MESPSRSMLPWQRVINSQPAGPAQPTGPGLALEPLRRPGTRAKIRDFGRHLAGRAPPGKVVFGTVGEIGARRGEAARGTPVWRADGRLVLVASSWGDVPPVRAAAPGVSVTISSVVLASSTLSCPPPPRTLAPRSPAPHTSPSAPHANKYPSMPEPTVDTPGLASCGPTRLWPDTGPPQGRLTTSCSRARVVVADEARLCPGSHHSSTSLCLPRRLTVSVLECTCPGLWHRQVPVAAAHTLAPALPQAALGAAVTRGPAP
ncbi:hypothetical protein E2C01_003253 [Portunus trituberculatus]|uniref:Uncharacterized protein n=1 Tax=Portunus trituberculatus TaxID=210409 RepID=A0A5B7CQL0_PORTR|nr:hypothetical protein [Portunus trituberculatus]